jgi:hypothetical protein
MLTIKIIFDDDSYDCPIEKALLIPKIRNIIKNNKNRDVYLQKVLQSNYDKETLASILHMLKN